MNNFSKILLAKFDKASNFMFISNFEIPENKKGLISKEFSEILSHYNSVFGDDGIIFSNYLDDYFYVRVLEPKHLDSEKYIIFSRVPILNSVNFYFKLRRIREEFDSVFQELNNYRLPANINEFKSEIDKWSLIFRNLIEIVPVFESQVFDPKLVDFIVRMFPNKIGDLLYSLIMEIPIIIQNINPNEIDIIYDNLTKLINGLEIVTNEDKIFERENYRYAHVYLFDKDNKLHNLEEYFLIDFKTKLSRSIFSRLKPAFFDNVVVEALEYDNERLFPFRIHVQLNFFWLVQKIFGAITLNENKVDFNNYLHDEELELKDTFDMLFFKLAFLKERLV